jgi:arsenate reductase-like glutaredoxin family protein
MDALAARAVPFRLRHLQVAPPTRDELDAWSARIGLPPRKLLNPSSRSYRALGKDSVHSASDTQCIDWLLGDGSLWRRPIVVTKAAVLVGFDAADFEAAFGHLSPSPPESANGSHAEPFIGQVDLMTHRPAPQG